MPSIILQGGANFVEPRSKGRLTTKTFLRGGSIDKTTNYLERFRCFDVARFDLNNLALALEYINHVSSAYTDTTTTRSRTRLAELHRS